MHTNKDIEQFRSVVSTHGEHLVSSHEEESNLDPAPITIGDGSWSTVDRGDSTSSRLGERKWVGWSRVNHPLLSNTAGCAMYDDDGFYLPPPLLHPYVPIGERRWANEDLLWYETGVIKASKEAQRMDTRIENI